MDDTQVFTRNNVEMQIKYQLMHFFVYLFMRFCSKAVNLFDVLFIDLEVSERNSSI